MSNSPKRRRKATTRPSVKKLQAVPEIPAVQTPPPWKPSSAKEWFWLACGAFILTAFIGGKLMGIHNENVRIANALEWQAKTNAEAIKNLATIQAMEASNKIWMAQLISTSQPAPQTQSDLQPPPLTASQRQMILLPAQDIADLLGIGYWEALGLKDKWNQEAAAENHRSR